MFSPRASVPARRAAGAARALLETNVAAAQQPLRPLRLSQPRQQQRHYAMRGPSLLRRRSRPVEPDGLLFKHSDIPPVDLWRQFKSHRGLGGLTPETCLSAVMQYCDLATQTSGLWKEALERDYNIDLYTLHYAALPLLSRGHGEPAGKLGMHMLYTASGLGYTSSTLTLMGIIAHSPKESRARTGPVFQAVESRFKRILQTEKNPDAFTLQGLTLLSDGQPDSYALRFFDKAVEAARSIPQPSTADQPGPSKQATPAARNPRWSYEGPCHQNRGLLLLKQNRTDEAAASFRIVAHELGLAGGYAELAKLLPRDAPERETYLLRAAQGGNFDACRLLALDLADRAADPALPRAERVHARDMAYEWARLEPDAGKREEVEARVSERTREVNSRG
ncbi:hypothetical protein C8A01DRAFT_12978 [Parachaetomium inaequale]|uniref:Uncharacterized protein n=1 Tax=Parachaetomium inaequale TaxID=2588326 RepID=A0AAN6PMI5_9PEZI|nr:hypothetical protein C8A01DRAFT_12978 [Parachaetomium inaequale]